MVWSSFQASSIDKTSLTFKRSMRSPYLNKILIKLSSTLVKSRLPLSRSMTDRNDNEPNTSFLRGKTNIKWEYLSKTTLDDETDETSSRLINQSRTGKKIQSRFVDERMRLLGQGMRLMVLGSAVGRWHSAKLKHLFTLHFPVRSLVRWLQSNQQLIAYFPICLRRRFDGWNSDGAFVWVNCTHRHTLIHTHTHPKHRESSSWLDIITICIESYVCECTI